MATYRKYNWPELFQKFEQSGLTQAQFCAEQNLNPKYFSRKRADFPDTGHQCASPFQQVITQSPCAIAEQPAFTLEFGRCKVHCPVELIAQLVSLIQALS